MRDSVLQRGPIVQLKQLNFDDFSQTRGVAAVPTLP
jgi:hypothetical protein